MTEARTARFLPEVQALRALAVALVVLYHVWPERLPGGFIGVDVFFVISGYLITAHLTREYTTSGSISLSRFWARRIRRLLPAAFVVLAACVVLVFVVLPTVVREETLRQVAAASGYLLNWVLGFDAVDYLAAGNEPTVVQHYWTLSVEEQFYIGWPVLLVVVGVIVARLRGTRPTAAALVGWVAIVVVVLSLAYSIYLTAFNPPMAYFATTTRAWEFAAGGLLAAAVLRWPAMIERLRASRVSRTTSVLTLGGVIVIVAAAFVLDGESPFPGYLAALPVVGTVLVILGGEPRGLGIGFVTRWRPIQFLGDISYSIYLWHWPLVLTLVVLAGRRPTLLEGLGIVVVTVALAALTKYFVEDPGRRSRLLARRRAAFGLAAAGILVFVSVWAGTSTILTQQAQAAKAEQEAAIVDTAGCFGAHAMLGTAECPDRFVLTSDVDLNAAANDLDYENWCLTWFDEDWRSCEFGAPAGGETWALVGDSHAASMVEALDEYFAQHNITLVTYLRYGCSGLNIGDEGADGPAQSDQEEYDCRVWSDRVRAELDDRDDISTVLYLNRTPIYVQDERPEQYRLTVDDIVATWEGVLGAGKRVVSITDWPITAGDSIPVCLSAHVGESGPCSLPRAEALPADPQDAALAELDGRVESIDLTDAFCDDTTCYSVIGDVVVYADHNHISGTYSRTLMPYLGPLLLGSR